MLTPKTDAPEITGSALEALAREYLLAEAVINRLSHLINPQVLHALIDANLKIELNDEDSAQSVSYTHLDVYKRQATGR